MSNKLSEIVISDSVIIEKPVEFVFKHFSNAGLLSKWWPKSALLDPKPGGKIVFSWFSGADLGTKFVSYIPDKEVSFSFAGEFVKINFEQEGDGHTIVNMEHAIPSGADDIEKVIHVAQSWAFLLTNLKSVLSNGNDLRDEN